MAGEIERGMTYEGGTEGRGTMRSRVFSAILQEMEDEGPDRVLD
jgi:hypothetical protein